MNFKKITIDDLETLRVALSGYDGRICDVSPGNLVFWRDYYDASYYLSDDGFVIRYGDMDGKICYYCPKNKTLADKLIRFEGGKTRLSCLNDAELRFFTDNFTCSDILISEDWNDCLYLAEDIVSLKGKRFSGQRNHINKFKKLYPNAVFREITESDVAALKSFCHGYFHDFGAEYGEESLYEEKQLYEQLDNLGVYAQNTGVLTVDGEVVGFSIGEVVGDTLIIHTEKANTAFDGVYPMLVQSFAAMHVTGNVRFINREEDCGVPGLRTSKRSYHPIEILNKYSVVIE